MEKKGRPSLFSETHQKIAFAMARLGATDKQIVEEIGITEQTLNNWKKKHIAFFESLKDAKQQADEKVEKALYERATGYVNKNAVKIFMPAGAESPVYAPYVEHIAPDVTACIFWLKNRRQDRWRDKQEIEHSGGISVNLAPLDESL